MCETQLTHVESTCSCQSSGQRLFIQMVVIFIGVKLKVGAETTDNVLDRTREVRVGFLFDGVGTLPLLPKPRCPPVGDMDCRSWSQKFCWWIFFCWKLICFQWGWFLILKGEYMIGLWKSRPVISWRQQRWLPPCPLVNALVPLNAPAEIYNFLIVCPLPQRKYLGALALSATKHTGPEECKICSLVFSKYYSQSTCHCLKLCDHVKYVLVKTTESGYLIMNFW